MCFGCRIVDGVGLDNTHLPILTQRSVSAGRDGAHASFLQSFSTWPWLSLIKMPI
jgi:hypothetical protein